MIGDDTGDKPIGSVVVSTFTCHAVIPGSILKPGMLYCCTPLHWGGGGGGAEEVHRTFLLTLLYLRPYFKALHAVVYAGSKCCQSLDMCTAFASTRDAHE